MNKEKLFKEQPKIKAVYNFFGKHDPEKAQEYLHNMLQKYQEKTVIKEKISLEEFKKNKSFPSQESAQKRRAKIKSVMDSKKTKIKAKRELVFTKHPLTGETKSVIIWAEEIGISRQTFEQRLFYYGNIPEIYLSKEEFFLKSPSGIKSNISIIKQIAQDYQISIPTARYRFKKYGTPENWPDFPFDYAKKEFIYELAKQYGVTVQAIYYRYRKYGLPDNWPSHFCQNNSHNKQEIIYEIAKEFPHISIETIRHRYKKYGLPPNWPEHFKS